MRLTDLLCTLPEVKGHVAAMRELIDEEKKKQVRTLLLQMTVVF